MINSTIILYGVFAGLVAILVTVAIERFGGFIGGVLGTIPSTIIPAAAGVYAIEGEESLIASMSVVPIGMLINGMFLGVWIVFPKYINKTNLKLPITILISLCTWAVLAFISLLIARQVTDGMISEASAIHSSHPNFLNRELKKSMLRGGDENPFNSSWFRQVDSREMRETILLDPSPCIVLATSGMMTGGPIIEYLKYWAPEPGNTLCFVGYQASGTLGRRLQEGHSHVPLMDKG